MNLEQQQSHTLAVPCMYSHQLCFWPHFFCEVTNHAHTVHYCTTTRASLEKLLFSGEHSLACSACSAPKARTALHGQSAMLGDVQVAPHGLVLCWEQLPDTTACPWDVHTQRGAALELCCPKSQAHVPRG